MADLHGLSLVLAPIKAEEVAKLRQRSSLDLMRLKHFHFLESASMMMSPAQ